MAFDEKTALGKISLARWRMLIDVPFFGFLALRLRLKEFHEGGMATDGTFLYYDPEFVASHDIKRLMAVVAHEVMHCGMRHFARRGSRDPIIWNIACDYAINLIIDKSTDPRNNQKMFNLPEKVLLDEKYANMSAEATYAAIYDELTQNQNLKDLLAGMSELFGRVIDGVIVPEGKKEVDQDGELVTRLSDADWAVAMNQAAMAAKKAGRLPSSLDFLMKPERVTNTNWVQLLKRFMEACLPQDVSWTTPDRRALARGVYWPGDTKENMPKIALAVDVSGSIYCDKELLQLFTDEASTLITSVHPDGVLIIYCDAAIQKIDDLDADEALQISTTGLGSKGGGGTRFTPVFDYLKDNDIEPACLIYLTDLMGDEPTDPGYPVMWVVPEAYEQMEHPFGEKVLISKHN